MTSQKLKERFLVFFKKRGHKIVPSSSLIPEDETVLLTSAGMQQFKDYYLEGDSPYGQNTVSCQKSFRTSDIEEVGDKDHLTFFEMLGNFSFGGYFKEESIKLAKEFLDSINIKIDYVTVFKGDKEVPKDDDSVKIWDKLGFSEEKGNLRLENKEENFWGPTGDEGPCGPTTEIYSNDIEIWNIVFNEYYCNKDKKLKKLKNLGVDTGMGLERLSVISQNKETIFETDLFLPIIKKLEDLSGEKYEENKKEFRIIADHIRGAVFLISDNVVPSNIGAGYILRRVLRRAIRYGRILNLKKDFLVPLAEEIISIYKKDYPEIKSNETDIFSVISKEEEKFEKTLERGLKEIERIPQMTGKKAFSIYETYGFPLEIIEEITKVKNREDFFKALKEHQEISRAGVGKKFSGLGKEADYEAVKLHTATHLLHQALRDVLGRQVKQMGSDITSKRLRFDFSHSARMTEKEIKKVEALVNSKIKQDLEVKKEEVSYNKAVDSGALAFFKEKYPPKVTVYSINDFSKEICAGPHAKRTLELGKFKIIKEESSGAGVRRIKAVLE